MNLKPAFVCHSKRRCACSQVRCNIILQSSIGRAVRVAPPRWRGFQCCTSVVLEMVPAPIHQGWTGNCCRPLQCRQPCPQEPPPHGSILCRTTVQRTSSLDSVEQLQKSSTEILKTGPRNIPSP
jgi:hypothetical protein